MRTYKLLRMRGGRLFPLYVEPQRELAVGVWLEARIGEKADEGHVKSITGNPLALRPGFHSTLVPFTDWIGKKGADGRLHQRKDTVWCECEVDGKEQHISDRYGLKVIPSDWYRLRLNSRQKDPWIISNRIRINRVLSQDEVKAICSENGLEAQPLEGEEECTK